MEKKMNNSTFTKPSFSSGSYATAFGVVVALATLVLSATSPAPVNVIKLEPVIISAKRMTAPETVFKLATVEISASKQKVQEAITQGEQETRQIAAKTLPNACVASC